MYEKEILKKRTRLAELKQKRLDNGEIIGGKVESINTNAITTEKELLDLVDSLIGPVVLKDKSIQLVPKQSKVDLLGSAVSAEPAPVRKILSYESIQVMECLPDEKVTYNKEIQTTPIDINLEANENVIDDEISAKANSDSTNTLLDEKSQSLENLPTAEMGTVDNITETQKKAIMGTETFDLFFDRATKIVERALNEDYDIFTDYIKKAIENNSQAAETHGLVLAQTFSNDRWTKGRCSTSVDWSPFFPELALVSYSTSATSITESDGLVLVWNLRMPSRPEFILFAHSQVMVAAFSTFNQSNIVAGTFSGQIVIWDISKPRSTPILATSLSLPGHSHPVYSLSIVGTRNAHNLITCSTDGVVCSWQMDVLANPLSLIELTVNQEGPAGMTKTDEVAITCMAFSPISTAYFLIGTEERNIYQVNRFDRASSKSGIEQGVIYGGHSAPVTGLHFYPLSTDSVCLFLSCSMDWSVKLWRFQSAAVNSCTLVAPLLSFDEFGDYVADVAWSPTHPAMFAALDGSGTISVFNLNMSQDVAIYTATILDPQGINKLKWNKDGSMIATATLDGRCLIHEILLPEETMSNNFISEILS